MNWNKFLSALVIVAAISVTITAAQSRLPYLSASEYWSDPDQLDHGVDELIELGVHSISLHGVGSPDVEQFRLVSSD